MYRDFIAYVCMLVSRKQIPLNTYNGFSFFKWDIKTNYFMNNTEGFWNQSVRGIITPRIVNSVSKTQVSSTKNPEFGSLSLAKATSCREPHAALEFENLRQAARTNNTKFKEY